MCTHPKRPARAERGSTYRCPDCDSVSVYDHGGWIWVGARIARFFAAAPVGLSGPASPESSP